MSLYDDLGVETSDSKTEGWSKNFKLLQSQLQVKKAALTQAKVGAAPRGSRVDRSGLSRLLHLSPDLEAQTFGRRRT